MKLTQETYYGIKLVESLGNLNKGDIKSAAELSSELGISVKFILKILRRLKQANILDSYRGITGGYSLKKKTVSLYEIIEILQGELYIVNEFKDKKKDNSGFRSELEKIQKDNIERLKKLEIKKKE
ncbi:RrF2 family transcriptional regulator [Fusobacterium sp.]|uniref:RrF2 family transcriptional regulator n=1 Tax=Fusobacterium sp. TaxID=68766 RepID=UPI002903A7D1|nr:Rrf2 family transcriptional regulator [Fusobacterium sp.]MDU1912353.1 Rrf2 family transcriptional regulator [Fusobacterium sp.]